MFSVVRGHGGGTRVEVRVEPVRSGDALLDRGVHLGFVAGAVRSAGLNLADRIPPQVLMLVSTWFDTGGATAFGIMVVTLTVGSAGPHLLSAMDRASGGSCSRSPAS